MTVIAWDGKTLAADKKATMGNRPTKVTKIVNVGDEVVAIAGNAAMGMLLISWYEQDRSPEGWQLILDKSGALKRSGKPEDDEDDDAEVNGRVPGCILVVASKKGVRIYNSKFPKPIAVPYTQKVGAWGSGEGYAFAALRLGKDAREAVKVASKFCVGCGMGVDYHTFE